MPDLTTKCNQTQTDAKVLIELQNLYSAVDAPSTRQHRTRLLRNESARRLLRKSPVLPFRYQFFTSHNAADLMHRGQPDVQLASV